MDNLQNIRKMTRQAILDALREARRGESEFLLKEVWESCRDQAEIDASDQELDVIINTLQLGT